MKSKGMMARVGEKEKINGSLDEGKYGLLGTIKLELNKKK